MKQGRQIITHEPQKEYWRPSLYIAMNLHQFRINSISFQDTRSNLMIDGSFTKIIYSDDSVMFNALYILLDGLSEYIVTPHIDYNQCHNKCFNSNVEHVLVHSSANSVQQWIHELSQLENLILSQFRKYRQCSKLFSYSLTTHLQKGIIKLVYGKEDSGHKRWSRVLLKISGIWEDNTHIGITCKFIGI